MPRNVNDPTPQEIARAAQRIRCEWTPETQTKRGLHGHKPQAVRRYSHAARVLRKSSTLDDWR